MSFELKFKGLSGVTLSGASREVISKERGVIGKGLSARLLLTLGTDRSPAESAVGQSIYSFVCHQKHLKIWPDMNRKPMK